MIIDGIDVSKCEFYGDDNGIGRCFCDRSDGWDVYLTANYSCVDNPNCYYKQLKRKEQECEELENTISSNLSTYQDCIHSAQDDIAAGILNRNATDNEFCKHVIYETRNKIKNLFNENIKLKQECEEWKGIASQYKLEKVKIQNRYQQLAGCYNKAESYNQALTEIENIIHNQPKDKYLEDCILDIIQKVKEQ